AGRGVRRFHAPDGLAAGRGGARELRVETAWRLDGGSRRIRTQGTTNKEAQRQILRARVELLSPPAGHRTLQHCYSTTDFIRSTPTRIRDHAV
uniref:Uncharacterized protein n=1 Tax=Triticum urartu TaxID=4572 RepID=A0A8R7PGC6_TRIUA